MPLRLFIAIEIPPVVRSEIAEVISELKQLRSEVRWEQPDKLHITLKFLGETNEALLPRIIESLEERAQNVKPFSVRYTAVGCFPNKREPRILWVGAGDASNTLQELASSIEDSMEAIGFEKETRRFHAHVTIGRVKGNRNIRDLIDTMESFTFQSQPTLVSAICLIKSELKPSRSEYTTLKLFNFLST